jgi:hypothetical protein
MPRVRLRSGRRFAPVLLMAGLKPSPSTSSEGALRALPGRLSCDPCRVSTSRRKIVPHLRRLDGFSGWTQRFALG